MTPVLTPGLLAGSAPPANGPPAGSPSGRTGGTPGQPSPFEQLLTAVRAVLQGGETATPPPGGTPDPLEPLPTPAGILAALAALAQGAAPGETSGEAETDLSLLDRLSEAGEELINNPEIEPGAAEALMSFLVTGGVFIPHTETPQTALPSLDVDVREVLVAGEVALEMAARAAKDAAAEDAPALTGTAGTVGAEVGTDVASQTLITPALQVAVEDVLKHAGVSAEPDPTAVAATTDTPDAPGGTLPAELPSTSVERDAFAEVQPSMTADDTLSAAVDDQPRVEASTPRLEVSGDGSAEALNGGAAGVASPGTAGQPQTVTAPVRTGAATAPNVVATVVTEVVQAAVLRGDSEVRLVLNPPEMGHLDIRIVTHEGGLRVSMEASHAGARDLIERALPALQQGLEARDLRVDRLEVRATDTGRGSLDSSGTGQQSAGGHAGDQSGSRDGRPEWSAVASFGLGMTGEPASSRPSQQAAGDGRLDVLA